MVKKAKRITSLLLAVIMVLTIVLEAVPPAEAQALDKSAIRLETEVSSDEKREDPSEEQNSEESKESEITEDVYSSSSQRLSAASESSLRKTASLSAPSARS